MRRAAVAWAAAIIVACGLLALPLVAFAATSAVNIQGFAYSPTPITIHVGDTVTWTNKDSTQHSARFAGLGSGGHGLDGIRRRSALFCFLCSD